MKNGLLCLITIFVISGLKTAPSILLDTLPPLPSVGLDVPWQVVPQFTPVQERRPNHAETQGVLADCNAWCMYPGRVVPQNESSTLPSPSAPSLVQHPVIPTPYQYELVSPVHTNMQHIVVAPANVSQSKQGSFGMRVGDSVFDQHACYHHHQSMDWAYYAACSVKDFAAEFDGDSTENVYAHFDLYRFVPFLAYCRQRGDFDGYVVALHKKINSDHGFRKRTREIQGFGHEFCIFGKNKSGFHEWVAQQAKKIEQQRAAQRQAAITAEYSWARACADLICKEYQACQEARAQWLLSEPRDLSEESLAVCEEAVVLARDYCVQQIASNKLNVQERAQYELGSWCAQRALEAFDQDAQEQALRYARRVSAIMQEGKCGQVVEQSYELAEYACTSLQNHDVAVETFMRCHGNATQQVVHVELVQTVNRTSRLAYAYGNDMQIQGLTSLVYRMCDVTAACNQHDYPLERRFLLSDLCESMLDMTSAAAQAVGTGVGCLGSAVHFGQAVLSTALMKAKDDLLKIATEVVNNPLPMAVGLAIGAVTPPAYMMAGLMVLGAANHQELCSWADQWLQDFKKNPDEAVGKSLGSVMSMLVVGSTTNVASKGTPAAARALGKHLPALEKLIANERMFASICEKFHGTVKGVTTPIKTMFAQGVESVRAFAKGASVGRVNKDHIKLVQDVWAWSEQRTQGLLYKLQNVSNDILDVMEKAGGHTLKKHVKVSNNELIKRALRADIKAVTRFSNQEIAIKSVRENLMHNVDKIAKWLGDNKGRDQQVFDFTHHHVIGLGVLQGKTNVIDNITQSRMVLEKDLTSVLGFRIISAFPFLG